MIEPFFRAGFHPALCALTGRIERWRFTRFLEERAWCSLEENLALQRRRLHELLSFALAEVPYYRALGQRLGLSVSEESAFEDLRRFPTLDKEALRTRHEALLWPGRSRTVVNTSGGSTGEPVEFVHDRGFLLQDATWFADGLAGWRPGDRIVRLWGSERDIIAGTDSWTARLRHWVYRTRVLNAFRMDEADLARFIAEINAFRPRVVIAYVQSAHALARFALERGRAIRPPRAVITTAGTLFPEYRRTIEAAFGCPVHNRYGSREVSCIAMECERHEGLHLPLFTHVVEVLDGHGQPAAEGEPGEVAITVLSNRALPLVRYRIGDVAVATARPCSCGRGMPLLAKVTGRTVDLFRTRAGRLVDGEYFTHLFYHLPGLAQFQVVQEDYDAVTVNVVPRPPGGEGPSPERRAGVEAGIRLVLGEGCAVIWRLLPEIPPSASGKFRYTISKVPPCVAPAAG